MHCVWLYYNKNNPFFVTDVFVFRKSFLLFRDSHILTSLITALKRKPSDREIIIFLKLKV